MCHAYLFARCKNKVFNFIRITSMQEIDELLLECNQFFSHFVIVLILDLRKVILIKRRLNIKFSYWRVALTFRDYKTDFSNCEIKGLILLSSYSLLVCYMMHDIINLPTTIMNVKFSHRRKLAINGVILWL